MISITSFWWRYIILQHSPLCRVKWVVVHICCLVKTLCQNKNPMGKNKNMTNEIVQRTSFLCNIDSSFNLMLSQICTLIIRVKKTRWYIHCCLTKTLLQGTKPCGKNKTLDKGKNITYQYDIIVDFPFCLLLPLNRALIKEVRNI